MEKITENQYLPYEGMFIHTNPTTKIPIFDVIRHYTDENANEIDNKQIELDNRQYNNTIFLKHNPICSKCPKIANIAKQGDVITI